MIKISKIDDKLSIYKAHIIVVWGAGKCGEYICDALLHFGFPPFAICDNDESKWGRKYKGIEIVSFEQVRKAYRVQDVLVQLAINNLEDEKQVIMQLNKLGDYEYICSEEARIRLAGLKNVSIMKKNEYIDMCAKERIRDIIYKKEHEGYIFWEEQVFGVPLMLCMPQKTGVFTIEGTLNANGVKYYNFLHYPKSFDKKLYSSMGKIKMITAVRDPIAQNLSSLYQEFMQLRSEGILIRKNEIWCDGGDVQKAFDSWLQLLGYIERKGDAIVSEEEVSLFGGNVSMGRLIQQFVPEFQKNIVDIMKCPFDTERGYTIIKEDNIEVFVYQIEKLNVIYKDLFKWVGIEVDSLRTGNEMSGTWLGNSYKQAQQEVTFSLEYFNKCYNEPYVKHFYSKSDIGKFKKKWRSHIS